ncbi:DUF4189 domain-containing protein [Xanthomonas sp. 3058]|uniref:DUF4189 domain-containing protein n=1 Tax=Xanthomonas sp. 3058 TaxID=3035314 RepID=UPI0017921771|nr:DUF4189 domain-containing protein [Xanthomonas sp. 3058]MBB5864619.1 hypothetical protein [Xanthomonas sp. 3058]
MKIYIFPIILVMLNAFPALAEQGCPPGQYPIGGQGAAACAPIPQGNSINQAPRPLGKWLKTWGAIAHDPVDGVLGVSSGKISKRDAEKDALMKCTEAGGTRCKDWASYQNQCAAVAGPQKNGVNVAGALQFSRGPSLEDVKHNAENECASSSGLTCAILYSNCSEQVFKSY